MRSNVICEQSYASHGGRLVFAHTRKDLQSGDKWETIQLLQVLCLFCAASPSTAPPF